MVATGKSFVSIALLLRGFTQQCRAGGGISRRVAKDRERGQLEAACPVLASVPRAWGGVWRAAGCGSVAGDTHTDGTVRNRTAAELVGPDEICRVLVGVRGETARGPVRQRPTRRSGKAESEQRVVLVGETR